MMPPLSINLADAAATTQLGQTLAPLLGSGDTILLDGNIGAGKSHLARAIILARLAAEGRVEDVPSPTFTLVQTYEAASADIWHADLYRLSHSDEALELGLEGAFSTALCLIEWPDRLDPFRPADALTIQLVPSADDGRLAMLSATHPRWQPVLDTLKRKLPQ